MPRPPAAAAAGTPVRPPDPQVRVVRIVLYLMLLVSAGCCLIYGDRLWLAWQDGDLPLWAPLLGPVTFTAFVGLRDRSRPAGKPP